MAGFDSILCHVFNDFLSVLPVADGVELVLASERMTTPFGSKQPLPQSIRVIRLIAADLKTLVVHQTHDPPLYGGYHPILLRYDE